MDLGGLWNRSGSVSVSISTPMAMVTLHHVRDEPQGVTGCWDPMQMASPQPSLEMKPVLTLVSHLDTH